MNISKFEVNLLILSGLLYLATSASIKTKRPETNESITNSNTSFGVKTIHQSNTPSSQFSNSSELVQESSRSSVKIGSFESVNQPQTFKNVPLAADEIVYGLLPADSPQPSTAQFGTRFKSASATHDKQSSSTSVKTFQENSPAKQQAANIGIKLNTQSSFQSTQGATGSQKRVPDSIVSNSHNQITQSSTGSTKSAISNDNAAQENQSSLDRNRFVQPQDQILSHQDGFGAVSDSQNNEDSNNPQDGFDDGSQGYSSDSFYPNQQNDDFYGFAQQNNFEGVVDQSIPELNDGTDEKVPQMFSQNSPQDSQFAKVEDPLDFTNQQEFSYDYPQSQTVLEGNSEKILGSFGDNFSQEQVSSNSEVGNERVDQPIDSIQQEVSFTDQSQRTNGWISSSVQSEQSVKSESGNNFEDPRGYQESGDPIEGLMEVVPGTPGEDYPIFYQVPFTSFNCDQQPFSAGIYGDVDASCQVFHFCEENGAKHSFLCPNGTVFNQQYFVCDWWYNYNCADTPSFYNLNAELYANIDDINPSQILSGQGIADENLFSVDQISSQPINVRVDSSQTSRQSSSSNSFTAEIQNQGSSSFEGSSKVFGVSDTRDKNEYQNENFASYDVQQSGQFASNFGSFQQNQAETSNFEGSLLTNRNDEPSSFTNENFIQQALIDPAKFSTGVIEFIDPDSKQQDTPISSDVSSPSKSVDAIDSFQPGQPQNTQDLQDGTNFPGTFQDQSDFSQDVSFEENNSDWTQNDQQRIEEMQIARNEQQHDSQHEDFNNREIFQQPFVNNPDETGQIDSVADNIQGLITDSLPNENVPQTQNENILVNAEVNDGKQVNTKVAQNIEMPFFQQELNDASALTPNFAEEALLKEFNNRVNLFTENQRNSLTNNQQDTENLSSFTTDQGEIEKVIFPETPKTSNKNSQSHQNDNAHKDSNLNEVTQVNGEDNQHLLPTQSGQEMSQEFQINQERLQQSGVHSQSKLENLQPIQQDHKTNSIQSNVPTQEHHHSPAPDTHQQEAGKQSIQRKKPTNQRVQQQNVPIHFEKTQQHEQTNQQGSDQQSFQQKKIFDQSGLQQNIPNQFDQSKQSEQTHQILGQQSLQPQQMSNQRIPQQNIPIQFEETKQPEQIHQQGSAQQSFQQQRISEHMMQQQNVPNQFEQSKQPERAHQQVSRPQSSKQQQISNQRLSQQNIPIQFKQSDQAQHIYQQGLGQQSFQQQQMPNQVVEQQNIPIQFEQSKQPQNSFRELNQQFPTQPQQQNFQGHQSQIPSQQRFQQQNEQPPLREHIPQQFSNQQNFQPINNQQIRQQQIEQQQYQKGRQQQYQQVGQQQQYQHLGQQQNQRQYQQVRQQQNQQSQYQQIRQQENQQQYQQVRQPQNRQQQNNQNQQHYSNNQNNNRVPLQNLRFQPISPNVEQQREFVQFPNVVQQQTVRAFDTNSNSQINEHLAQMKENQTPEEVRPAKNIPQNSVQARNQEKPSFRPISNNEQVIFLNEMPPLQEIAQVIEDEISEPQQNAHDSSNEQNTERQPRLNDLRLNMQTIGPEDSLLYSQNVQQIPIGSVSSYNGWRPILKKY